MRRALALLFLLCAASQLHSQGDPTASRAGDLQVGVGYSSAKPDYVQPTFLGFTAYCDFDFRKHLGVEAEFHQVYSNNSYQSFQRSYEIGGRYFFSSGPFVPYGKVMIGRGDFSYPFGQTERGYNMYAGGAGADFKLGHHFRVRGEYEFQKWTSFPNWGLTPQLVTFGFAYHVDGRLRK